MPLYFNLYLLYSASRSVILESTVAIASSNEVPVSMELYIYFTAPAVSPLIKLFCINTKAIISGTDATSEAAIMSFHAIL